MANVIATVITDTKSINTSSDARGVHRHAYNELVDLQTAPGDPVLVSPYLLASHVTAIPAHTDTITSGNFTITMNFPNYGVAVTTANIAYNAEEAAIQTAVDTAMASETIVDTYTAGDVDVALTGNLTANAAAITANGASVAGAYMLVTTANVDLDANELSTPVVVTAGTMNRPAEAMLALFDVVKPSGTLPYQGQSATAADYELGDNPFSLSPGLQKLLIQDIIVNENMAIGAAILDTVGCVGPNS